MVPGLVALLLAVLAALAAVVVTVVPLVVEQAVKEPMDRQVVQAAVGAADLLPPPELFRELLAVQEEQERHIME